MFEGALNPSHILIVLIIALVVLGPKRLPEMAKSMGSGLRELKSSFDGSHDEPAPTVVHAATATPEPAAAPAAAPVEPTPPTAPTA